MLNVEDRAKLINALKYALLIWAVPWPAFVAASCSISLIPIMTGSQDDFPPAFGLLAALICYATFSALLLRCGEFLLRVQRQKKYFETSFGLMFLMLPIVLLVFVRYACY